MDIKGINDKPIDFSDEQFPGQSGEDLILAQARERAATGWSFWEDNYNWSNIDRTFLAGYQWPNEIRLEREAEKRPMLTINKLPQFVNRVNNDMMQNPTDIKCQPVEADITGDEAQLQNFASKKNYSESEVFSAIIKNIEYNSNAQGHYNRSAKQMIEGAIAWLRVYTVYNSDDSFECDLRVGSVKNPTSGMIDPTGKEPDHSDAMWGFVYETYPRAEFQARWPDARMGDLSSADESSRFWETSETVTVAEYMERVPDQYMIFQMSNGSNWDSRDIPAEDISVTEGGEYYIENNENLTVERARKVTGWKVVWRKITAHSILEGGEEGYRMPFSSIPLVPMLGNEVVLEDKVVYESLIRHALDPQREFNYWRTAATEMVALQPKAPYIGTETNFENNEDDWANANRKNFAYLSYTPDEANAGAPPQRQPMAQNPGAEINQAMVADESMKAAMGIYDPNLGNQDGNESGRAILARQKMGDLGVYHFTEFRDKAIERVGKLLVEAIPKVYDTERIIRLRFPDDTEDFVKINYHQLDENGEPMYIKGKPVLFNDISKGKYDVRVTSGPSYNTLRVEAVNSLIEFISAVPGAGTFAMDIIARNMDFPGAEELADRLKRALPPQVLDPEEAEDAQQPPPTPEQLLEMEKNKGRELEIEKQAVQNEGTVLDIQKEQAKSASQITPEMKTLLEDTVLDTMVQVERSKRQNAPQRP